MADLKKSTQTSDLAEARHHPSIDSEHLSPSEELKELQHEIENLWSRNETLSRRIRRLETLLVGSMTIQTVMMKDQLGEGPVPKEDYLRALNTIDDMKRYVKKRKRNLPDLGEEDAAPVRKLQRTETVSATGKVTAWLRTQSTVACSTKLDSIKEKNESDKGIADDDRPGDASDAAAKESSIEGEA